MLQENIVTLVFVKRAWWNPIAALIRWAVPVSRFKWARSSHSMVLDGDHVIHATMLHGVVRQPVREVLKANKLVQITGYHVPDASRGKAWLYEQIGKPYDFTGAFGLSLSPDRKWQEDDKWFCHELCAATLSAAGMSVFVDTGHVTDSHLMMLKP